MRQKKPTMPTLKSWTSCLLVRMLSQTPSLCYFMAALGNHTIPFDKMVVTPLKSIYLNQVYGLPPPFSPITLTTPLEKHSITQKV